MCLTAHIHVINSHLVPRATQEGDVFPGAWRWHLTILLHYFFKFHSICFSHCVWYSVSLDNVLWFKCLKNGTCGAWTNHWSCQNYYCAQYLLCWVRTGWIVGFLICTCREPCCFNRNIQDIWGATLASKMYVVKLGLCKGSRLYNFTFKLDYSVF